MKYLIYILYIILLPLGQAGASNNLIFGSGAADGHSTITVQQATVVSNNAIFGSGGADGFSLISFSQTMPDVNNPIFASGGADGFSLINYHQPLPNLNNLIFASGAADGFALIIIQQNIPLPVELIKFEANTLEDYVRLDWTTASETNSDYFEVQRAIDPSNFITIATEKAQGESNARVNYYVNDIQPVSGVSYYRLKQVDQDGTTAYSEVISVNRMQQQNIVAYPNPVNEELYLSWDGVEEAQNATIRIIDQRGMEVKQMHFEKNGMEKMVQKVEFQDVLPGIYIVELMANNLRIYQQRIIKK